MAAARSRRFPETLPLDGELLIYVRNTQPLPSVTLDVGMAEEPARRVLAAIAKLGDGSVAADGSVSAMLHGLVPVQAAYVDGHLVATTHPGGVPEHLAHGAGFADHADVAASLAEVPRNAYAACVVRTEAWCVATQWAALLGLALPAEDAAALRSLPQEMLGVLRTCHEVIYATADAEARTTIAHGPVLGLLGLLFDIGNGALPLAGIWN